MARKNGSLTLTEGIFTQLRTEILCGQLSPGSALMPSELRLRFKVSISVIREALIRLAEQGLAKQNPNHGFTVITISSNELKNIIEARKINEGAALRLAIPNGDVLWESNIVALHHQLEQTVEYLTDDKTKVNDDWTSIHRQFHYSLIKACNNQILLSICKRLWNISDFYRHWALLQYSANRDFASEHKALMEAVLAHDSERAAALLSSHIQLTADILIQNYNLNDK